MHKDHQDILDEIDEKGILSDELQANMREAVMAYTENFKMLHGE